MPQSAILYPYDLLHIPFSFLAVLPIIRCIKSLSIGAVCGLCGNILYGIIHDDIEIKVTALCIPAFRKGTKKIDAHRRQLFNKLLFQRFNFVLRHTIASFLVLLYAFFMSFQKIQQGVLSVRDVCHPPIFFDRPNQCIRVAEVFLHKIIGFNIVHLQISFAEITWFLP